MGLAWLQIVPDLGNAFGPAWMGMRLAMGRSMKIGLPCNLPMDPDLLQVSCRDLPRVPFPVRPCLG